MKIWTVTMLCTSSEYATCVGLCKTEDEAESLMQLTAEKMSLGELYQHEKGVWSDLDYDRDFDDDFRETIFRIEAQTFVGAVLSALKKFSATIDMDEYLQVDEGIYDSLTLEQKRDLLRPKYLKIAGKTRHIVRCAVNDSGDAIKLEIEGDISPSELVAFITDGVASDNTLWRAFALKLAERYDS